MEKFLLIRSWAYAFGEPFPPQEKVKPEPVYPEIVSRVQFDDGVVDRVRKDFDQSKKLSTVPEHVEVRSRRFEVLRGLHAVDARRFYQTSVDCACRETRSRRREGAPQEWVDLRLAEGYDGSIILEALDWVEHSLDSLPHVQRRLRRNESGLCADVVRPESIDFQFLCRNDRRWEAELYICAGEDENKSVEQRHSGVARTPLQLAAESGCLNVVYLLLERHAEVEAEDRLGRRPLHLAAQQGHTDVCIALVDSGEADVHATDHDGNTPLHLAAKANKAKTVHQLANIEEHQIRDVSGRYPG